MTSQVSVDEHISDEALAAWSEGTAAASDVSRMTSHVAGCDACRALLSALSRSQEPEVVRVGRYALREKVGAGGMGTVWSAWDSKLSRQVAVKVSHQRREGDDARFLHERHILAGLEHPNIARLLDAGETDERRPWFAMDFVDGVPIDQYVTQQRLPVRARVELFLPVLAAVQHAHRHLVVHRDIKPANVLVGRDGQPRLVDFGIARLLGHDARLTQTGQNPMTPAWASPEQVRGEPVTTSSDVFSLGVVLYELLTFTSPWRAPADDLPAMLSAIRESEPLPCSRASRSPQDAAALEGDLDAVVAMALRKDPKDRYQSPQAFADDLRAYLDGAVTLARQGDRRYRLARFLRRHALAVGALVAVFLALTAGLISTARQARIAAAERDRAQHRFEQVRALAHAVLFDYHDGIADLPGSTPLRERLAKDAKGYLDSLASEVAGDPALQRELAAAWLKVGDVQGNPFAGSLGDTASAQESYLRGKALAQELLASLPQDWEGRRLLALSEEKLGTIDEVGGRLDDAAAQYERAAVLGAALVLERPDDAAQRFEVSRAQLGLGEVRLQQNALGPARAALEASLASRRATVALSRAPRFLQGLGSTLDGLAELHQQEGHNALALEAWTEAVALFDESLVADPLSASGRRGRKATLNSLATGFLVDERSDEALEITTRSVGLARESLAADPQSAVHTRDLAVSLQLHAHALGNLKRFDASFAALDESRRLLEGLFERDPTPLAQRDLLASRLREGEIALEAKRLQRALRAFTAVRDQARALLTADPSNGTVEEWLAFGHNGVASVLRSQGNFEAALRELRESQAVFAALLAREPDNARLRGSRAISLVEEGHLQRELKRADASCVAHRKALEVFDALEKQGQLMQAMVQSRDDARKACP